MLTTITTLFERDLTKLKKEINLYKTEEQLWEIKAGINNSGGNLALHLIGNLNHFIGATLGNIGYVREREKEFSLKNIPRIQLIEEIHKTIDVIKNALLSISPEDLGKDFPVAINNTSSSKEFVLTHLLIHLSYHLGQINYHRRLID